MKRICVLGSMTHDLTLKTVDFFSMGNRKIANNIVEMQKPISKERDKLIQDGFILEILKYMMQVKGAFLCYIDKS